MITRDTEFGAPWNDQCYTVQFYLTWKYNHIMFTSNVLYEEICLPGPKKYTEDELYEFAKTCITQTYADLFELDSFVIHIEKID